MTLVDEKEVHSMEQIEHVDKKETDHDQVKRDGSSDMEGNGVIQWTLRSRFAAFFLAWLYVGSC